MEGRWRVKSAFPLMKDHVKETHMRAEDILWLQWRRKASHSYSALIHILLTHTHTRATTGRKTSSWRLSTPFGMRASSPSSSSSASSPLNGVIWLRFALLHRAKLISSPINAELKRGFKYLTAAVNNMQRITLQVCVCFFFFSPTVSLSLSLHLCGNWYCSYSCRIVQRDDGNAAVNAHPLPVWASSSHKAAVQPPGGGLYLFV